MHCVCIYAKFLPDICLGSGEQVWHNIFKNLQLLQDFNEIKLSTMKITFRHIHRIVCRSYFCLTAAKIEAKSQTQSKWSK